MKLDEIVTWYQKKIGTYDKQEWEKTIEQRILNGFTLGPLKTTKLKTEYIDVDLVRGSSFPKAKPKQRFLTVIKLAILRYLLLPLYAKWWVAQTSPRIFSFLLLLYLLQMFNWAVYSYNVHQIDGDNEHMVSLSEFLIPIALGLLLSMTHSQIVATSSNSNTTDKQKRVRQPKRRKRERPKRRKKNTARQRPTCDIKPIDINNSDTDVINTTSNIKIKNNHNNKFNNNNNILNNNNKNTDNDDDDDDEKSLYSTLNDVEIIVSTNGIQQLNENDVNHLRGKRNVNWHSPIKSQLCYAPNDDDYTQSVNNNLKKKSAAYDKNIDVIENLVKEFLYEIMDKVDESLKIDAVPPHNIENIDNHLNNNNNNNDDDDNENNNNNIIDGNANLINDNVNHIEDDGFESLNGKSSSGGEDNHIVNAEEQQQQQQPPESQQKLLHITIEEKPKLLSMELMQNLNVLEENANTLLMPTAEFMGGGGGCSVQEKYPNFTKWVKDTIENTGIDKKDSDSDTDTLKGNDLTSKLKRQQRYNANNRNNNNDIRSLENRCDTDLNTSCTEESLMMQAISNESPHNQHVHHSTPNSTTTTTAFKNTINVNVNPKKIFSSDTDEEGDDGETPSVFGTSHFTEGTTSATEWIGITTNSEECSYSSEIDNSDSQFELSENGGIEYDITPSVILNPSCGANDRISCTIWYERDVKKAEMSVLDISSAIIERIEAMPDNFEYLYIGICFSIILSFVPALCRLFESATNLSNSAEITFMDISAILIEKCSISSYILVQYAFGVKPWETTVLFIGFFLRICLTFLFFFLLTVAERTFKQRFLYAKLFSHLTSSRRARKSAVPHFRLNKVRNIKTWLSVRSYLKRRGPQRSVDVIVSAAFLLTLLLLSFLSVEWLKDSVHLNSQCHLEALTWSCALGCFLLRFMTLGTKINRKYRSISVLITEQINLYLQIEQKPHKKEELMVSNSVLKLAADLLKELESPFKIYGLCANPYLYTTVKVVILSALSGILSEMLGFKLKLHKIKIK